MNVTSLRDTIETSLLAYGADPTGNADSSSSFTSAIAALSSGGILHIRNGTYKLSGNITIPKYVTLSFDTAIVNVQSTYTLVINGSIIAPTTRQIFSGAGTVAINGNPECWVSWFGTAGDGTTDDSAAVQAAITAATSNATNTSNVKIKFPPGNFLCLSNGCFSTAILNARYQVMFEGSGTGQTVVTYKPSQAGSYLYDGTLNTPAGMIEAKFRDMWFKADGTTCGTPTATITSGSAVSIGGATTIPITAGTGTFPNFSGIALITNDASVPQIVYFTGYSGGNLTGCTAPGALGTYSAGNAVVLANPVNFFRQNGNSPIFEQNWRFDNCWFSGDASHRGIVLRIEGSGNGDSNVIHDCRVFNCYSVIHCSNAQAVCHWVTDTNFEGVDDAFVFVAGGQLTVLGGSFISNSGANNGAGGSLLRLTGTSFGITAPFQITNVRLENNDNNMQLFRFEGGSEGLACNVHVTGCSFNTTHTGMAMGLAQVNPYGGCTLVFENCELQSSQDLIVSFKGAVSNWFVSAPSASQVIMRDCKVNPDFQSKVTWDSVSTGGIFSARGCLTQTLGSGSYGIAMDCDMSDSPSSNAAYPNTAANMNVQQLKSKSIWLSQWPSNGNHIPGGINLPPGAVVKAIRVNMAARGGGDSSPIQFQVQNHGGSYVYGTESSFSSAQVQHQLIIDNIYRLVTSGNDLQIEITLVSFTGVDSFLYPMIPGDLFVVEYY